MDASSFLEINPAILERKYRQYNFALNDYFCLEKGIALHFNKLDLSQIVLNRGKNIGEKFAVFPMRKEPIFQPKLNWLVDCLYIVLRPTRKYSIHMEPSPLSGLKNLGLNCLTLKALEKGGTFITPTPTITRGSGLVALHDHQGY